MCLKDLCDPSIAWELQLAGKFEAEPALSHNGGTFLNPNRKCSAFYLSIHTELETNEPGMVISLIPFDLLLILPANPKFQVQVSLGVVGYNWGCRQLTPPLRVTLEQSVSEHFFIELEFNCLLYFPTWWLVTS